MKLHRLALPALALVLAAGSVAAQEPAPLQLEPAQPALHPNQHHANAIAAQLRSSGLLRAYQIEISFQAGTAELRGIIGDATQRDEAARLAQSVPGVQSVINRLEVAHGQRIAHAQYPALAQEIAPPPRPISPEPIRAEPLPAYRNVPPAPGEAQSPPMPPYAWPTYAPYNNYSRVGTPISYPPDAFPFIGPPNPFPRVPLGWRKVMLEWNDGHWWLSTHAQKRDWWVLRYW